MKHIDMKRIDEIFGDEVEARKNFMQTIVLHTTKLLSELAIMIEKRDLLAVKNAFHRLKGSAINCGLNKLHDLAKDAEEEAEGENWRAVSMFYDKIKVEFDAIQQEISTEFKLES